MLLAGRPERGRNKTMPPSKHDTVFLATTALEEFWDFSKPIVFLGEWCRLYDRRHIWEPLNSPVVPFPWDEEERLAEAIDYTESVYKKLLPQLSSWLNNVHGIERSTRYWQIIFGWGLSILVQTLYDKYVSLRRARDRYPNLSTIALDPACYSIPSDFRDLSTKCIWSDLYNLQLYSGVCKAISLPHTIKRLSDTSLQQITISGNIHNSGFWDLLRRRFGSICPINLYEAHFSRKDLFKLFIFSGMRACPISLQYDQKVSKTPIDQETRESLRGLEASDPFAKVVLEMLVVNIPRALVEDFQYIRQFVMDPSRRLPKIIATTIGWHLNFPFAVWMAECVEKGTIPVSIQEGGANGIFRNYPLERRCIEISDRYITYGWKDGSERTVPLGPPKAFRRTSFSACMSCREILWISTVYSRYPYILAPFGIGSHLLKYLLSKEQFYSSLREDLKACLNLRIDDRYEFGWALKRRWREKHPGIHLSGTKVPLVKAFENSRLIVIDSIGATSLLQALASGRPVIFFNGNSAFGLRKSASEFYNRLIEVQIGHETPLSAARVTNEIYDDVDSWWKDKQRSDSVEAFVKNFARSSTVPTANWGRYLRHLLKTHTHN